MEKGKKYLKRENRHDGHEEDGRERRVRKIHDEIHSCVHPYSVHSLLCNSVEVNNAHKVYLHKGGSHSIG